MRGVSRSEPKFLAIYTNLDVGRFSLRTKIPGDTFQLKCEAPLSQNQKFLAIFTSRNVRRFSVRTEGPGGIFQFDCDVFVGQDKNFWQWLPV